MWKAVFRDHEIFIRTGGEVRFLKLSATLQRRVAVLVLAALGAWLAFTLYMLASQLYDSWYRNDVAARAAAVASAEARLAAAKDEVETSVASLNARQNYFESVLDGLGAEAQAGQDAAAPADSDAAAAGDEISALDAINARQQRLVLRLTALIDSRSARAEAALRSVGIRPAGNSNQGGPFIPDTRRSTAVPRDAAFRRLASAFDRMQLLEGLIVSIPSTLPADGMNLSSGFGYRRDPFTGGGAMHSGLDFKGAHASPIRAAAAGRVSFVGRQSGYGNTVEVDHGHGIVTRYAHLSGYVARLGDVVTPGQLIARMGSTGRSTGTHLHFEVRVGGSAVNPRRFLEANPDVLEVQADVGQRVRARVAAR